MQGHSASGSSTKCSIAILSNVLPRQCQDTRFPSPKQASISASTPRVMMGVARADIHRGTLCSGFRTAMHNRQTPSAKPSRLSNLSSRSVADLRGQFQCAWHPSCRFGPRFSRTGASPDGTPLVARSDETGSVPKNWNPLRARFERLSTALPSLNPSCIDDQTVKAGHVFQDAPRSEVFLPLFSLHPGQDVFFLTAFCTLATAIFVPFLRFF